MDEKFMQQVIAELIESTGQAVGLLAGAIAKQIDAEQLAIDLQTIIKNADAQPGRAGMTVQIATHALDAARAQAQIQQRSKSH